MFDFHLHSRVSYDADSDPLTMARAAQAAGLREICFTDHIDYCLGQDPREISFTRDAYRGAYEDLTIPGLSIRRGVELGLTEYHVREAARDSQGYDFVIGSVHHVDNIDIYLPEFWQDKTPRQAEARYFETMLRCVRLHSCFDVLGHVTFVSKSPSNPAPRIIPYADYGDLLDEVFRTLIAKGKGIEVNTSGLGKVGDFFPGREYLLRFRELGGEIVTVGSDAHWPERVGEHIPAALELLRDTFGYVCTFRDRQPQFHKL